MIKHIKRYLKIWKIKKWCIALSSYDKGKALLSNIIHDIHFGRVSPAVLNDLFTDIYSYIRPHKIIPNPVRLFRTITSKKTDYYHCAGPKIKRSNVKCSRIIDSQSFFEHNIDTRYAGFSLTSQVPSRQIKYIQRRGLKNITKNKMENSRGYCWITKTDSINNVRRSTSHDRLADTIRNMVGWLEWEDDELVEIRYPKEFARNTDMFSPTFIDGCPSLIYRSTISPNQWGRTVDTSNLADSLPEAVHKPIDFSEEFEIIYIGKCKSERSEYNSKDFLRSMPILWHLNHFRLIKTNIK